MVDERQQHGQFVLIGSQNLSLTERINQSLAGRTRIFTLLPLGLEELHSTPYACEDYRTYILQGFYPRLYDQDLAATDWLPSYIQTYVERNVR